MYLIKHYRGMYLTVLVTVVIALASLSGVLRHGQGWFYDQFVNAAPPYKTKENQVFMVYVGAQESAMEEADWIRLLGTVQGLGARQVVFSGLPPQVGASFFDQLRYFSNVVIGRTLKRQENGDEKLTGDVWPAVSAGQDVPFGIMALPVAEHGISRTYAVRIPVGDDMLPSLAVAAAQAQGVPIPASPGNEYLINFNAGRDRLPKVSAARVLDDALIPELVAGRTVLIGMTPDSNTPGVHTPNTYGTEPLSLLEFQGHALDTLLGRKHIRSISPPWMFGMLLLTAFASLLIYKCVDVRMSGWFTLVLLLFFLVVAWAQLHYLNIWIPVFELSLSQGLLYLLIARHKVAENDRALRRLIVDGSTRFHETAGPAHFYDSSEYWTQVITLVDQVLNLRRLIFLEKVEGDHRVREVKALNCSIDVIDERRRDYERTPYSTAIAEGGPILLQHHYLKPLDNEDEDQYLVPLVFAGEVLGFWAFGVIPQTVAASNRFLGTVAVFASQIAEILYHRSNWQQQNQQRTHPLRALLSLEEANQSATHVQRLLELAQRRVSGLEAVFNSMDTAAIVYDLFGRVLHLNRRMEDFMRKTQVPGYELTALDLLVRITDCDYRRARELLSEVAMESGQFRLPVTSLVGCSENFMLSVRAVSGGEKRFDRKDAPAPFEISGLLFELINVSQLKGAYVLKDEFVERFGQRMRRELGAIVLGSDLLREKSVSIRDKGRAARILHDKITGIVELFGQARRYMQVKVAGPGLGVYPVDATQSVASAMQALAGHAEERGVHFVTRLPEVISLVNAPPQDLNRLMHALLEALLNDAAENTAIEVAVEERDSKVSYRLSNTGFGIPNERFQGYLFGGREVIAEEFKNLHDAIQYVGDWEGRVAANSEVGTGMTFDIELRTVI